MRQRQHLSKRLRNIVPYLTIIFAFISGLLGTFFNIVFTRSEGIILLVLGFLATDNLIERISILKRIEGAILEVSLEVNRITGKITAKDLFDPRINPFEMREFDQAKELSMSGVTFNITAVSAGKKIINLLDKGCKVRLMMMDPSEPGIAHYSPDDVPNLIKTAKDFLGPLRSKYSNLEIRFFNYNPPFGMVMVDSEKPHGFLVVTTYPYKTETGSRPRILLRRRDKDEWYEFYKRQFEAMWKDAVPWTS